MLSKKQQEILKSLYAITTVDEQQFFKMFDCSYKDDNCKELFLQKYLRDDTSRLYQSALIHLTEKGRAYVENHNHQEKELRRLHRNDSISITIAILALIVSIITSCHQFCN